MYLGNALRTILPIPVALTIAMFAAGANAKPPRLEAQLIAHFAADEARQGVAVDDAYFYAVDNAAIGKYRKSDGELVERWTGGDDGPWQHLNSCKAIGAMVRCAHSNSPHVPMANSVEYFSTTPLEHSHARSLGIGPGYLTWLDDKDGFRWALFANYRGRIAGRDPGWTELVKFDRDWRRISGWILPQKILASMRPASSSGGAWGPDGLLYMTGHDRPEIYVLRVPRAGAVLEHVATIAAPIEGQAFSFDLSVEDRIVYAIDRSEREVRVLRLPSVETAPE